MLYSVAFTLFIFEIIKETMADGKGTPEAEFDHTGLNVKSKTQND